MRSLRAIALPVAGLAVAVPAGASAARLPCRLVFDIAGDGNPVISENKAAFDIRSGDVATNGTTVTTVMRLGAVETPGPTSPWVQYSFAWRYGDYDFSTEAITVPNGTSFYVRSAPVTRETWLEFTETPATGVFDAARGEVRVSFPVSLLGQQRDRGGFRAFNLRTLEATGVVLPAPLPMEGSAVGMGDVTDDVVSNRVYQPGTRNCVTPGR